MTQSRLHIALVFLVHSLVPQLAWAQPDLPLDAILERMAAHDTWQDRHLAEYTATRRFYAVNPRFKLDATLYVETSYRQPETLESKILHNEGSKLIRERVFEKILEAEAETHTRRAKHDIDITPVNYDFRYVGNEYCNGRPCYRLGVRPKRRDKYSLLGDIWVDSEDFGIVKIHGSPAKRPSFWTQRTDIERSYRRVDGMWLPDRLESDSDIFIGGRSTLLIEYDYSSIKTVDQ
jgi:hypothetical protein